MIAVLILPLLLFLSLFSFVGRGLFGGFWGRGPWIGPGRWHHHRGFFHGHHGHRR